MTCAFSFTACANDDSSSDGTDGKTEQEWGEVYNITAAYAKAVSLGYTGTLEEFIESISGKDGTGILKAEINSEGYLILTLTDLSTVNCGQVSISGDIVNNVQGDVIYNYCPHRYSEWSIGMAPTCTSIGYNYRTCELCCDVEYEFIPDKHTTLLQNDKIEMSASAKYHSLTCEECNSVIRAKHEFEDGVCKICGQESQYLTFILSEDKTHYIASGGNTCDQITTIVISSTYENLPIMVIEEEAFANYKCGSFQFYNFDSVVLPTSISKIGNRPFPNVCTINYLGTRAQWEAIEKADGWDNEMNYTIICIDD